MTSLNPSYDELRRALKESVRAHWRLFLFQGIILLVLGMLALAAPAMATLAVDIYIGWLFLLAGIAGLMAVFSVRDFGSFLLSLIPAALSLAVGGLLIWKPAEGAVSLTALMAVFFLAEGLFQAVASIAYRNLIGSSWGWILLSGIADLVLAGIIVYGWPVTAVWALGVLAGVNLITTGMAIAMNALAGHSS
jgi:uncharacterized membrane protein HdeD (DUF308 family)